MRSGRLTHSLVRALDAVLPQRPAALPPHLLTGRAGEEAAYFYLRRLGYVIVARNYRSPRRRGELDLVGWDGDVLCFVEVKTRTTREVKPAEAAVDAAKQQEVVAMAREYLRRVPGRPVCRCDVVSVYCENGGAPPDITLYKNAFRMA